MTGKARQGGAPKLERTPAADRPVAKVLVEVPLPAHLDRPFDYLVPEGLSEQAVPGCRLRVRLRGKLVDGFLLDRQESPDFQGSLSWVERVTSPEVVLPPQLLDLARDVAERYAGMLADVVRLVVPPRNAKAEQVVPHEPAPVPDRPAAEGWNRYVHGQSFVEAVHAGRPARAVWQALPGEDWPARLAEAAAAAAAASRGALIVVPDYRDAQRLQAACAALLGASGVVSLTTDLGPQERYRRWLSVLRGNARVVVGTRAAMFAPVHDLGLAVIWDDGDSLHSYPQVPHPHARDVLIHRAHAEGAALVVGGHARTAEAALLVESGYARDLTASREQVRASAPRVTAIGEDDTQIARDPTARAARLPSVAFQAARAALQDDAPVLVQVPRRGYVPSLACGQCRERARCRRCAGPLSLPGSGGGESKPAACRWCGAAEAAFRCPNCGSRSLRAMSIGAARTAEELGKAFSNTPVRTSGGGDVLSSVPQKAALIVSTPGAEPTPEGHYGAALLLDARTLLTRPELRATEDAMRHWFTAAAMVRPAQDGGRVVVMAEAGLRPVQALVRWDPSWYASQELAEREELAFPPARRVAAVDGTPDAIDALLDQAELPAAAEVLGPVPLDEEGEDERERALVRVPRTEGRALARALHQAMAVRAARKASELQIRMDPLEML
jgi:primosomal protein N' (replication factor Y)